MCDILTGQSRRTPCNTCFLSCENYLCRHCCSLYLDRLMVNVMQVFAVDDLVVVVVADIEQPIMEP